MSDTNFSYTPESAWAFFEHTIQGDRFGIGCFENDLRPEGTNRGFAVAMVRYRIIDATRWDATWEKVCEASRWFEGEQNYEVVVDYPWIDDALKNFNEWLREEYGEDADLSEFEEFIRDISNGLAQFKVGADGKSFVR